MELSWNLPYTSVSSVMALEICPRQRYRKWPEVVSSSYAKFTYNQVLQEANSSFAQGKYLNLGLEGQQKIVADFF